VNTEPIKTKIRLGDIKINGCILKDGSYAAPGLFRLTHTDIYRYGECWYWLGNVLPDLETLRCWDTKREAFISFQGNRLSYLHLNPLGNGRESFHVPLLSDIESVVEFCILGRLTSDEALSRLERAFDNCYSGDEHRRALGNLFFLTDTECTRHLFESSALDNTGEASIAPGTHERKIPKGRTGFIYLVRLDAHLKLGFTRNLDKRLEAFKTTSVRVELIHYIKGTFATEKYLHSTLDSKVRELYDLEAEDIIVEAMIRTHHEQIKRRFDFDS
jgi:hypothetical protein